MCAVQRRSTLEDLLKNSIWCDEDSRQFMNELLQVCSENILYQRTDVDRQYFEVHKFDQFFYKRLKEDVQCNFLKKITESISRVLEVYNNDCDHTLHFIFNDKVHFINTLEVYSFEFNKTYDVDKSAVPLQKNHLIKVAKSILMSIANLRQISNVMDIDKIVVSFSLVYKEEGIPPINMLHPTLGSFYHSNKDNFPCKTIDLGNFWTGFHKIILSGQYEMENFVRLMFEIMERAVQGYKLYPSLPESPPSLVDCTLEERLSELIILACGSDLWSKFFINQLIRSIISNILFQRTNITSDDFETIPFKDIQYAIIKKNPSHLIPIKINKLFPYIYKHLHDDQIYEIQFIFCNASMPHKSFEVYQFLIKTLECEKNHKFTDNLIYNIEQKISSLFEGIKSFCLFKPKFTDFSTYFRLHFVEHAPLPKYDLPYYEMNAYHRDKSKKPIIYKTTTLGSVATGFHEITLIVQHNLMNLDQYLEELHENYEVETVDYNIMNNSDEPSDEEIPGPSHATTLKKINSISEDTGNFKKNDDAFLFN